MQNPEEINVGVLYTTKKGADAVSMLNVSAVSSATTNTYNRQTQVPTVERSDADLLEQKKTDSILSAKELHGLMSNSRVSAITNATNTQGLSLR